MSSSYRRAGDSGGALRLRDATGAARLAGTLVAAGLLYAASPAPGRAATSWNYDPRVEVGGTYDDNFLLGETPQTQTAVGGPFVNAQVTLHGAGPRSDLLITPEVDATLFPGHSQDQSTNGSLNVSDTLQTQRTKTQLTGSYADQTIVEADFLPASFSSVPLGQPVISNSGLVAQLERQQSLNLSPSTSIQWSQRGHLDLGANYFKAWFSQSLPGQIGFESASGYAGVGYAASQRADVSLRGSYIDFLPEQGQPSAQHVGLDGEWDYRESKIMQVYARAGVGATRGRATLNSPVVTLTDFEGGIGGRWHYQVTDLYIDLLRTAEPSSFGVLVNQDEARLRLVRRFTPMVAGFLALRGFRTVEAVSGVTSVPNREYATGAAGFEWRITENYSLEASYTYSWQKFQYDPLYAASNGVGVSIVYEPHRFDRAPDPGPVGGGGAY